MKVLKLLALAGMLSMVFPLASSASDTAAKEQKKNVAVADTVVMAGKTLNPGQYKIEWSGNGPVVHVKFLQNGNPVVTVPAKVTQLAQKAPYDAVIENTKKNGSKTISQIEWNNQRETLTFGPQAQTSHARHTRKRAS
jgi:putative aminopeptidase FrvX